MESAQFLISSIDQLDAFAKRLTQVIPDSTVIALTGQLGAGKTAFAQAMARAIGISEPVPSPTFTLVNEYTMGSTSFIHCDWYRLNSPEEIRELGISDHLSKPGTLIIVEWADRDPEFFPQETIWLDFAVAPNHRVATIRCKQDDWEERLRMSL